MHILSEIDQREFASIPQLVRLTMAEGECGLEPTLLIKANTLNLKAIVATKEFTIMFIPFSRYLIYGIVVYDIANTPLYMWSVIERDLEAVALQSLANGSGKCSLYLFNEIDTCVAEAEISMNLSVKCLRVLDGREQAQLDKVRIIEEARSVVRESFDAGELSDNAHTEGPFIVTDWHLSENVMIGNRLGCVSTNLGSADEGGQQEVLAAALIDPTYPEELTLNPKVLFGQKKRELTDVLAFKGACAVLIESKTLAILEHGLSDQIEDLVANCTKGVNKALDQIKGANRVCQQGGQLVREGSPLLGLSRFTDRFSIVLVPDLSLLTHEVKFGGKLIKSLSDELGHPVAILDIIALKRSVQAACHFAPQTHHRFEEWFKYLKFYHQCALSEDTPHFSVLMK